MAKDSMVDEDSRLCSSRGDAACEVGRRVASEDGGIDGGDDSDWIPNSEWPWPDVEGDSGMGTIPGSTDTDDSLHLRLLPSGDIMGATKRLVGVMPVLLELLPSESFVD